MPWIKSEKRVWNFAGLYKRSNELRVVECTARLVTVVSAREAPVPIVGSRGLKQSMTVALSNQKPSV